MRTDRRRLLKALAAALASLGFALPAPAQVANPPAQAEVPLLDPWVPPAVREKALSAPKPKRTSGADLEAQVERKLRARFDAASAGTGVLTREQARAAGLGAIARDFDRIERSAADYVTFAEYLAYLKK